MVRDVLAPSIANLMSTIPCLLDRSIARILGIVFYGTGQCWPRAKLNRSIIVFELTSLYLSLYEPTAG